MSQQRHQNEDIAMLVATLFILGLVLFVIWYLFHTQLTDALRWVRWAELHAVKMIEGDGYTIDYPGAGPMTAGQWRVYLRHAPVEELTPQHLRIMTLLAVPPMRMIFTALIGLMALAVIFFGPGTRYRRRMGLEGLMREQARSFPAIQPFLKFDPRKLPFRVPGQAVPAQLPLFAEALSPEEWMTYHEVSMQGGRIDVQAAYKALALQLGKRWQGPERLAPHAQGLYAAFALKHARRRKESEALLHDLARSWSADRGFRPSSKLRARIRRLIRDPKVGGAIRPYADKHAWETTAMLRCLARAREEGGVLAPAEFLWLRGQDRNLWYPLNNLGRKSYHAEASGAMVHYTNELISGQKIPTPRLEEVIRNFEAYMTSGHARPIPPLDKKAGGAKYWKK